mgnify:CR=1 FL=1
MKKIHAGRKISLLLLCLILGLTTLSPMAVSAASDDIGSRAEPGEGLNSVEQGETGTYTVEKSGYYICISTASGTECICWYCFCR